MNGVDTRILWGARCSALALRRLSVRATGSVLRVGFVPSEIRRSLPYE